MALPEETAMTRIATWNVNSIKVRLPQVLEWLEANSPDVLCLQETKAPDDKFPVSELEAAGYRATISGQKTYNGVAILSKAEPSDEIRDLPGLDDPQRRVLGATFGGLRVLDLYVPNGQAVGSDKYAYKLDWLEHLIDHLSVELAAHEHVAVVGDFNIAPEDRDVHDPEEWRGEVLCSEPERSALQRILALGFEDTFRLFDQPKQSFSWWDYRMNSFKRNRGLRIDLVLASSALARRCTAGRVDVGPRRLERPSDHAPAVADFDL
jgi:exodeoxyribonuclease-3